mgnify:CR=1 FL=1
MNRKPLILTAAVALLAIASAGTAFAGEASDDALATTRGLIETIQRLEREDLLPYNDTMELEAMALTRDQAPKRGLPR